MSDGPTGLTNARASPQDSSSAAATSVSDASTGSPGARASPRVSSSTAATLVSAASPTASTSALTVGSGNGFDAGAVRRDLKIMENVDREDAKALLQWCEERSDRAVPSTIPSSARAKPAPAAEAASSVPWDVRATAVEVLLKYFPKDGDTSKHACLLVLAESADARQHEIIVFPDDGDMYELESLYGNLSEASYNLGIAYRAMGNQISPNASRVAFFAATRAREIGERCWMRESAHTDLVTLMPLSYFYMISSSPVELRGRRLPRAGGSSCSAS